MPYCLQLPVFQSASAFSKYCFWKPAEIAYDLQYSVILQFFADDSSLYSSESALKSLGEHGFAITVSLFAPQVLTQHPIFHSAVLMRTKKVFFWHFVDMLISRHDFGVWNQFWRFLQPSVIPTFSLSSLSMLAWVGSASLCRFCFLFHLHRLVAMQLWSCVHASSAKFAQKSIELKLFDSRVFISSP